MLVAPLDWGLGHATRCIPLIEKLLIAGFKVIIAAEGDQKILLQSAFPDLELLDLKGYRLRYGSTKWRTIFKIIFQVPKILTAINRENRWLRKLVNAKHLDAVIADNRYGLRHKKLVSVFITHQLHIRTGLNKMTDSIVQRLNYHFINRFRLCWVPDTAGEINLAGALSHPLIKPRIPIVYIGIQSRIRKQNLPLLNPLLVLLSGPEPQRSLVEKKLLAQLAHYKEPVVLVRGLPAATDHIASSATLTVYNYLAGPPLEELINQSAVIISRSGYSTIMDLLPLGKQCIFIPTPGQAEQEYLATYLAGKQYAATCDQDLFFLPDMLENAKKMQAISFTAGETPDWPDGAIQQLMEAIDRLGRAS